MGRRTTKTSSIILCLLFLMTVSSFSLERLTTSEMRENTIRINALELQAEEKPVPPEEVIIVLDGGALNFDFDKWNVKEQYFEMLQRLTKFIVDNGYTVTIVGHTDSIGSDEYNIKLSYRRANATKEKFIEFGVPAERIVEVIGKGEREPVSTNETKEGRWENRRVELHLKKVELKEVK